MTIENQPLVTVIVPSFNHEKFITQCIESIINQSYKSFELIVIDDGSSDASRIILQELQKKYNFILEFQENKGVAAVLNKGITTYAKGKYVTFCASDDYWVPEKIEKQIQFMEKNQFFPMCFGQAIYVDEDSNALDQDSSPEIFHSGYLFDDLFLFKVHPPVNYLFRTEIFAEVGLYDESLAAEDYDMNLRISSKYAIGFLDETLFYYRVTNVLKKTIRFEKISNSHLQTIEKFKSHPNYYRAKRLVFLRKFDDFSGFRVLKKRACINMMKSVPLFYHKRFVIAIIKLVLFWK